MANKNDVLEELADEINDLKSTLNGTKNEVAGLKTSFDKLIDALPAKADKHEQSEGPKKEALRSALVAALCYVRQQNDLTKELSLSNADYEKLVQTTLKIYAEELRKARVRCDKEYEDDRKRRQEEYDKKREAQGFNTIEQVAEWAPDYPYPIQRFMRYLGVLLFDTDEEPEKMKSCVKVLGNVMLAADRGAVPTFKTWALYRWGKFKKSAGKWSGWCWGVTIYSVLSIVFCLSWYQSIVMDLDRTNRLFYRQVMQTEQGRKEYHKLDSLIHNDNAFKTYRTLDK